MAGLMEMLQKFDWTRFSVRERLLGAVTAAALLIGIYFMWILPAGGKVRDSETLAARLTAEIAQGTAVNTQLRARVAELQQTMKERAVADEISMKAPDILPGGSELSSFLEELTRLARLRQVDFVSIRPQSVEDKGAYVQMNLNIDVKARFRQFGEYLLMLEDLPRALIVEQVRIETTPEASPFVMGHLNAVMFMAKE